MKNMVVVDEINLSVIDDHPITILGIEHVLNKSKSHNIRLVNKYTSGKEVLDDILNLHVDVLMIDMCLPDIKGYELARKILEVHPFIKIGIYSNMIDKEYIVNSFRNGALGYLPKTASSSDIIDFILKINKGVRYITGFIADILIEDRCTEESDLPLNITKRENEVLLLVLDGYKNKEIADKLCISGRTVEFHRQNIYIKFEVNNLIDLYKAAQIL